eukprot:7086438-Ditylum_brightwellii.AAC.1
MIEPGLRVELVSKEMVEQIYDYLTEAMQRLRKQYDKQIDMIEPRKQHAQPRELHVEKEQHCNESRGIKPNTFLPSVMTPDSCELRDQ